MPKKKTANKWKVETVPLTKIKLFEDNPRTIKNDRLAALRASMNRFGYVDLIVWNKRTGHVVGGHQRYKVLVEQGIKEAQVIVVDMSEKEELAANMTLNNPAIEGTWDDPVEELLERVEQVDPEFFTDANFDQLRKAVSTMTPESDPEDLDTECPCCGHRWEVSDEDVVLMTRNEQELLRETEEDDDEIELELWANTEAFQRD